MNASTALESMPPDRNAPIGTSLTICMRTDSSSRARTRGTHSLGLHTRMSTVGRAAASRCEPWRPAAVTFRIEAIGSLRMPRSIDSGAGT